MNAKLELSMLLKEALTTNARIKCAKIQYKTQVIILVSNHTKTDFNNFLKKLDFEYDDDYGYQELYGCVWFTNGTWAERLEYDGCEKWQHKCIPEIPKECI